MESRNNVVPSAWLTHPVYSSQTWIENRDLRLERTLDAAQDIRKWLLKASSIRVAADCSQAAKKHLATAAWWDTSAPH